MPRAPATASTELSPRGPVEGDDLFAAARYANAAAALATTGFGAVAPLPRDADVRALLERAA
jgi:sugar/nucleoside kinase (ribokinase family)